MADGYALAGASGCTTIAKGIEEAARHAAVPMCGEPALVQMADRGCVRRPRHIPPRYAEDRPRLDLFSR